MQPNIALAEQAGLAIAPAEDGGGILVDEFGHTSAPGVFAAGDVANQPTPIGGAGRPPPRRALAGRPEPRHRCRQEHGLPGIDQSETPFDEVPWCWSDQYGHTLQVVGWPLATHELVVRGSLSDHDFTAYLLEDGVIRGAVAMARPREIRTARTWIAEHARLEDVLQ